MDTPLPQDEPSSPEPRPVLMRPDPLMKVSPSDWQAIRHLAESGVRYAEIAQRFNIKPATIEQRSSIERWLTPQRLRRAKNGNALTNDPSLAVVDVWSQRSAESREMIHQGMNRCIQRFFAMSPVPQSFSEAAIAVKLMNDANPTAQSTENKNVSVTILASKNFSPSPVIDC